MTYRYNRRRDASRTTLTIICSLAVRIKFSSSPIYYILNKNVLSTWEFCARTFFQKFHNYLYNVLADFVNFGKSSHSPLSISGYLQQCLNRSCQISTFFSSVLFWFEGIRKSQGDVLLIQYEDTRLQSLSYVVLHC